MEQRVGLMTVAALAAAVAPATSGCGVLTTTIYAATGDWPKTSSWDTTLWSDGAPTDALLVEARLESPPRALCDLRRHVPASRVAHDAAGFDTGGRVAYGLVALSELSLAAALAFIPRGTDTSATGFDAGATVIGLDGIATLAFAFLIPDTHTHTEQDLAAHDEQSSLCPGDVAFEAAGQAFPVAPDGTMRPIDGRSLMLAVVETGAPVGLRFRGELRTTVVPPELRCQWAIDLGSAYAPAVCPHAPPPVVVVPVPVPVRPRPIVTPR